MQEDPPRPAEPRFEHGEGPAVEKKYRELDEGYSSDVKDSQGAICCLYKVSIFIVLRSKMVKIKCSRRSQE